MKLSIPSGTTSKRIGIFIQDSSSTVGAGLSGLAFNTSGLKCYSWIDTDGNAAGTAQTLATATLGTWTTIGFVEKDATNMKGMYEFGIPNALIAAGVKWCILYFFGATNMAPLVLEIEVTAVSNQDGVHGGMSALPNTACTTNASLLTSGTGTDQLQVTSGLASANEKQINGVATTSVTTVAAVVGTTIAPTFTGSLIKSDVTDWNATAVATPATAGIPEVNVKNINNVATTPVTTVKAVQGLTTADTIVTYTGNTPQTGDVFKSIVIDSGTAQSGAASSIQLRAGAPDIGTTPRNLHVVITGGTGVGQVREVGGWTNGTKTVTLNTNWVTSPDVTSTYAVVVMTTLDNQAFPAHFSALGISAGGAITLVTEAQLVDEVVLCDALTTNNDKTNYSLAAGQLLVKKNTQLAAFMFVMTDSTTHAPATGLTVAATRSIDGAAFGACANAVAEIANGWYKITLAATDLNGTVIALRFTAANSDDKDLTIITQP